jgi:hypothetical protein
MALSRAGSSAWLERSADKEVGGGSLVDYSSSTSVETERSPVQIRLGPPNPKSYKILPKDKFKSVRFWQMMMKCWKS